mgnify:CR=1 FL=1
MNLLLENWRKFMKEEVINTREDLVALLRDNPEQRKALDIRKGEGAKSFGKVEDPPKVVEFDYGEFPDLINPADDMGWDFILADNSDVEDENLLPVGHVSYIEDKELWDSHSVEMAENIGGNLKVVLAKDGEISGPEKDLIVRFFGPMWQFKEPEWYQ